METNHVNSNAKNPAVNSLPTDSGCDKENTESTLQKESGSASSKSAPVEPLDPEDKQALEHIEKQLSQNHINGVTPDNGKVFDDSTHGIDIGRAPPSEEVRKQADNLKEEANSYFKSNF